ncbi:dTDP-4-amino-4,6-dideoxygalactose transaminase [Gordonibacter sp. RACS_AR68]|uniref:dTDP-4-amino-4,6-dideoxygalactose transaminase n=1 Tax=Gordonibacter sp. RACS_AR68 TaxID=2872005 RepID=UPI0026071A73|nr:dTDP-4-amino-4,6-dideoxygalactose transaminase [Gordonibacter sp. RACS_AR68]MDN4470354.1 dTDP-4-amino-4,6-dideoxygalactose transaminase [Gordonibacter sp. RACS_AR68]
MIPFNKPAFVGTELDYVAQAVRGGKTCGDGPFTKRCHGWLEHNFGCHKALLTTSGTSALEMAAILCDLAPGDEVIMPSYTFSSTANAFVLVGANIVFVDIRPDTMNIDERKIEAAITSKTKVIVPVHYAGVACDMDAIMHIARTYGLKVVEDAAQGVMSTYRGLPLGTIGDFGCLSFHETKNYSMGEGGALLVNDPAYSERAEIIREKGTDRARFFRGQVDKYTWVDYGSSYLPSDLNAAYLWGELEQATRINDKRLTQWERYRSAFESLAYGGMVELPTVPVDCAHNAHMFYLKCRNLSERSELIAFLKAREIQASFHYVPLHSAPAGVRFGRFHGSEVYTTVESERLVRLPLYFNLSLSEQDEVIEAVKNFYDTSALVGRVDE